MDTLSYQLKELFSEAAAEAFADAELPSPEITEATQERFGDYQYNSSMNLAKLLKKNPREIAAQIQEKVLEAGAEQIEKLEIAGPGFINITLKQAALENFLQKMLTEPDLAVHKTPAGERVVIDFSSPNTAKEMHVGHLRSTIIGDALARHLEFLGYDVLRLNHVGDWGTAFGMLIAYMKQEAKGVLEGKEETDLSHLMAWYKASKKRFDEDPEFKKQSQLEVVELQAGNPDSIHAWEIICEISRRSYQEIYDLLDVDLVERGESFYNPALPTVIDEFEKSGLVTVSDGAKCVFLEGYQNREGNPLPLMIQKSDGGYNYDTTDLAAIQQRLTEEKATHLIYVTDQGQATHFKMIFDAAKKIGWYDAEKIRIDHVPFGLVLGEDGKKLRTRSGETIQLMELITKAIERAREILKEKNPSLSEEELDTIGKAIGIGAIKYADLSINRQSDYLFSYDKMLRFEGNTAAYLMYSYVRINGIKRKSELDLSTLLKKPHIQLNHPTERALALQLTRFSEAVARVTKDLSPNRMTDYLYNLAEKFHAFFRDCRVVGSDEEASRLLLAELTARTMKQGLTLLGVHPVEKM